MLESQTLGGKRRTYLEDRRPLNIRGRSPSVNLESCMTNNIHPFAVFEDK